MRSFLCIPCRGKKIHYSYVLMHGFGDIPALSGSLESIEKVLEKEAGVLKSDILKLQMPPLKSIEERTNSAIRDITAKFSGRTVHLIAHSMGGLNARDIAARSGTGELKFMVKTVTTFGTPHFGVKALEKTDFVDALVKIAGTVSEALIDMKPSVVTQFNERTRVNPDVEYFTWAGQCTNPLTMFAPLWLITKSDGPTDCVINVSSAKWDPRYCTQLGVFKGVDHFTILSKKAAQLTIPHLRAAERGEKALVIEINNNLASTIGRQVQGTAHTVAAPGRAFLRLFK